MRANLRALITKSSNMMSLRMVRRWFVNVTRCFTANGVLVALDLEARTWRYSAICDPLVLPYKSLKASYSTVPDRTRKGEYNNWHVWHTTWLYYREKSNIRQNRTTAVTFYRIFARLRNYSLMRVRTQRKRNPNPLIERCFFKGCFVEPGEEQLEWKLLAVGWIQGTFVVHWSRQSAGI